MDRNDRKNDLQYSLLPRLCTERHPQTTKWKTRSRTQWNLFPKRTRDVTDLNCFYSEAYCFTAPRAPPSSTISERVCRFSFFNSKKPHKLTEIRTLFDRFLSPSSHAFFALSGDDFELYRDRMFTKKVVLIYITIRANLSKMNFFVISWRSNVLYYYASSGVRRNLE